ncbi:hypothetical protein [Clostridium estertheticum]|uniref:Uncharacterized protein n=1 Tax=Clostridium estertheticum TaxID=238834 RepID=A0AA47EKX1_9CLOT|nr:hypothetical protein [Clostridium estertheticum]MBU3155195.1 hypothetical protein [Clostridium estertheticum]WAG61249.1 hypothetical protein LL038_03075 [Clostridium estertheticum]
MANGDLIKLGTLYLNGTKQLNPTNPVSGGNIPNYSSGNIEIRDTDAADNYKINWTETTIGGKKLLVAERNILVNVNWDTLNAQGLIAGKGITINGQEYKLRTLTGGGSDGDPNNNEWNKIFDANSDNTKWHWKNCYSWVQNAYLLNAACRVVRGSSSSRFFDYYTSYYHTVGIGWRPALETLNPDPLISDLDKSLGDCHTPIIKEYTVSDSDGFSVVEKIDGNIIRTLGNQLTEQNYTLDLTSIWGTLTASIHTIMIEATDSKGAMSVRTWTFNRIKYIKYLLKQNYQFYTIKSDQYKNGKFEPLAIIIPTSQDYETYGFDDLNLPTQTMTIGTETFRPIDKFDKSKPLEIYKCIEK